MADGENELVGRVFLQTTIKSKFIGELDCCMGIATAISDFLCAGSIDALQSRSRPRRQDDFVDAHLGDLLSLAQTERLRFSPSLKARF